MNNKMIAAVLLALGLLAATDYCEADEWRTQDTVREVVWQALNLADMATTHDGAQKTRDGGVVSTLPDGRTATTTYAEKNPLIGRHPSPRRVINAMTLGAVAHAGISYVLPHGWRDAWQYLTIGTSAYCVRNNISIGLEVRF